MGSRVQLCTLFGVERIFVRRSAGGWLVDLWYVVWSPTVLYVINIGLAQEPICIVVSCGLFLCMAVQLSLLLLLGESVKPTRGMRLISYNVMAVIVVVVYIGSSGMMMVVGALGMLQ